MSFYNKDGKLTLEPGEFKLEVGGLWSTVGH